jgi:hypothetical protein
MPLEYIRRDKEAALVPETMALLMASGAVAEDRLGSPVPQEAGFIIIEPKTH